MFDLYACTGRETLDYSVYLVLMFEHPEETCCMSVYAVKNAEKRVVKSKSMHGMAIRMPGSDNSDPGLVFDI